MKILRTLQLLMVCILFYASATAQTLVRTVGKAVSIYSLRVAPDTQYSLNFRQSIKSLSLLCSGNQALNQTQISAGRRTQTFVQNIHSSSSGQQYSQLVLFAEAASDFHFFSGKLSGTIIFHVYHLGNITAIRQKVNAYKARFRTREACGKPASVPQSVWRANLEPLPLPDPVVTEVKHLIIHHSVSSNTAADQVAIMRGIYLYHRVTLGWNDIAYNYLIAPDGTIYEGRDPQGKETEGDNIRGGHFCTGRQDGTMGVCLLGTFTNYEPPTSMLTSLINLLSWKVKKDGMNPYGTFPHPINNPVVAALPVIAGHREGCSTQCPGNKVYEKIADIRAKINIDVQVCAGKTDHCAPLRITGDIYNAVYRLSSDFDTALKQCQSLGTGCDKFCSGTSFFSQITSLRSQIKTIEQACTNDPQNCIEPCNSIALLNELTTLEQKVNAQLQFWLSETSNTYQQVARLESEVNQTLNKCLTNIDSCGSFYPINQYEAKINLLKSTLDSLQKVCATDTQTNLQNAKALSEKLTKLENQIAQRVAQLGKQTEITAYPNPVVSNGVLYIRNIRYQKITQLSLTNILGKSIKLNRTIPNGATNSLLVLLPKIPAGWYMLRFELNGEWHRRRVLIQ